MKTYTLDELTLLVAKLVRQAVKEDKSIPNCIDLLEILLQEAEGQNLQQT